MSGGTKRTKKKAGQGIPKRPSRLVVHNNTANNPSGQASAQQVQQGKSSTRHNKRGQLWHRTIAIIAAVIISVIFVLLIITSYIKSRTIEANATTTAVAIATTTAVVQIANVTAVAKTEATTTAIVRATAVAETAVANTTATVATQATMTALAYDKALEEVKKAATLQFSLELSNNPTRWGQSKSGVQVVVEQNTSYAVQYYEKGRMDYIFNRETQSYEVRGGLLMSQLLGAPSKDEDKPPCAAIFGDAQGTTNDNPAPSYRDVAAITGNRLASIYQNHIDIQNKSGYAIIKISPNHGQDKMTSPLLSDTVEEKRGVEDAKLLKLLANGHHIPRAFCTYLARLSTSSSMSPCDAGVLRYPDGFWKVTGLPISEPMWTQAQIGTEVTDVMFQAFERRMLIYYRPDSKSPYLFAKLEAPVADNTSNLNQSRRVASPSITSTSTALPTATPTMTPTAIIEMTNSGTDYWEWKEKIYSCPDQ
jgi:hypothetical protein